MCPLWPLHIVLMYLIALCPLWFVACQIASKAATWGVQFSSSELESLFMYQKQQVGVSVDQLTQDDLDNRVIRALVNNPDIASVSPSELVFRKEPGGLWSSAFTVSGDFLGYTSIKLCMSEKRDAEQKCLKESKPIDVTVKRKPAVIDKIFTYSVIVLVSIIFINFGCALDVNSLKQAIMKPIGPVIGLLSHFLFLPLLSYGLGELLFPDNQQLRLGLFFTGISPAGGASNIWTYSLGGNLNLSVTMTAVSTLASFGLIPLWVFTLGQAIFKGGPIGVPYSKIMTSAVGLVVPLAIGYVIQVYCKRLSNIMVRILKPFSALLIVFIVLFATITNFYLFKLFTWEIVVAGIGLPLLGYLAGLLLALALKQKPEDVTAISIETGVQNTGIAIFLLKFCLPQPAADITTVAPVAVALMTPLPLLMLLMWKRCRGASNTKKEILVEEGHHSTPPLLPSKY
uniref:p3 protein n=1 Tax=Lygus hesperus TaxID=30085 RepID=A0A146LKT8_LYGHE